MSLAQRRGMVDREHLLLSIARQCALLGVARSSLYYQPREASGENLALIQAMDRQYLDTPFYGSRRMKVWLAWEGRRVSRKLVQRLMRIMGLRAIYRSPRTSRPTPEHRVYPYLLEKIRVIRPNQAWAADITYLPMAQCQGRRQNMPVGRSKSVPAERSLASVNVRASCSGEVSHRQAGSRLVSE